MPAKAKGVRVVGDWNPLGMRATVSRTLLFEEVFVPDGSELLPPGVYFQAASRWPHMFMTLTPAYMGLAQAAYDFTVKYLRGELPGAPPVKRRMYPTKQLAVADMRLMFGANQINLVPGHERSGPESNQRAGFASLRCPVFSHGEFE